MKVIAYPSLAQKKEALGLWISGVSTLLAISLFAASRSMSGTLGLSMLVASVLFLFAARQALMTFKSWSDGDGGEWKVVRALRSLPDDYTVIRNWVVPDSKQGDVDIVVLGPHGVLVVEVKNYRASYECDGDDWINVKPNGYRKRMKSPSRQLKRNAEAVSRFLRIRGWKGTVSAVLVVSPSSTLRIDNPTVAIRDWNALTAYIQALPRGIHVEEALFGPESSLHRPCSSGAGESS